MYSIFNTSKLYNVHVDAQGSMYIIISLLYTSGTQRVKCNI